MLVIHRYNASVEGLQPASNEGWLCSLADGRDVQAKRIVSEHSFTLLIDMLSQESMEIGVHDQGTMDSSWHECC